MVSKCLNNYIKYDRYSNHPALFTAQQPKTFKVSRLSYRMAHKSWVGLMGIEELRALMGHESLQTTLRYQKVTSLRAFEVAQKAFEALPNFSAEK